MILKLVICKILKFEFLFIWGCVSEELRVADWSFERNLSLLSKELRVGEAPAVAWVSRR